MTGYPIRFQIPTIRQIPIRIAAKEVDTLKVFDFARSSSERSGLGMMRARLSQLPAFLIAPLAATFFLACGDGATAPPPDAPRPTTIRVSPATVDLAALGATVQLSAQVDDQNGQTMAGAAVTWASSAAAVAAVSASGLVTAVANGSATVTATSGSASGSAAVIVAQTVSSVAVSPAADTLVAGDTLRFSAEAADANGHPVAGVEFQWTSSDTAVTVVDDSGLATGVSAGEAEIGATTSGVAGGAALTVVAPVPAAVEVTPNTVELTALGETARLTAEVRDQIGRVMTATVLWSSADTLVVTVDSAGLVTAAGEGGTTVVARSGEASGEAVVTVMQAAGAIVVSPAADTVLVGDTLRLVAEAYDANGNAVTEAAFTWSSSNASVATVDVSGLVTGVAEGAATIAAMTGDARGVSEITVVNPDRAALVALYNATNGPNWVDNTNWLTDAPLGEWYGVSTDSQGRVVQLDLSGTFDYEVWSWNKHGLQGELPVELASLTGLTRLDLRANDLTGPIPPELEHLTNLQGLSLGDNELAGAIPPELGSLASLERLSLDTNNLTGRIPPGLGNLANLKSLVLSENELTGRIPPELGKLASLQLLILFRNNLTDQIPPELGNLAELVQLDLHANVLSGPISPQLGELANLRRLWLDGNLLSGPIPAELGNLAELTQLSLDGNNLTGPIPPELGRLTKLGLLSVYNNDLTGPIPAELGNLVDLRTLRIAANRLTGTIPRTFLSLPLLEALDWACGIDGICVPGTPDFVAWVEQMEETNFGSGPFCNAFDQAVLSEFFELTGGDQWTESEGWLGGPALSEWMGVSTDSLGRVTSLVLSGNGLSGGLPASISNLEQLSHLRIDGNALGGRLPLALTALDLDTFHYDGTELCTPADDGFQAWLRGIESHTGTGTECAPSTDRDALVALYETAGGAGWSEDRNWLSTAPLRLWHGVEVDNDGRVVGLDLGRNSVTGRIPADIGYLTKLRRLFLTGNNLSGPIPEELGSLAELTQLSVWENNLTGPIPPELGNLTALKNLSLMYNHLTGPIPEELGNLAEIRNLRLAGNSLTGPIPSELGNLARLIELDLSDNDLTGPVPRELGNLSELVVLRLDYNDLTGPIPSELGNLTDRLAWLWLSHNSLTGPIPPELGNLSDLEILRLTSNDLSGSVPPEFGELTILEELGLAHNAGLTGALPQSLTGLDRLDEFLASGTGLCAPTDADFQAWLGSVRRLWIAPCVADPPAAYLTQAVQSREFPVPLVAGEKALLRVFPTAEATTIEGIPLVRARFYMGGRETHVQDIPGKSNPIPTEVDEGDLSRSANAEIPNWVIQPGLEMVIEVDPDGTLDPGLGVTRRIPEMGRVAVKVEAMPLFDLTLIPFIWTETDDSSIVELVEEMAADPEHHEMLGDMRTLLPIADLAVTAHEPVVSSSNSGFTLLSRTDAIRVMEGGTGHYMGMMSRPVAHVRGVARLGGRASFSMPFPGTIAHELGHNLSLTHAPCGSAPNPDPSYPSLDGSIGAWGYDVQDGGGLIRPFVPDLMSYCGDRWISDYHFTNALRYRLVNEGPAAGADVSASTQSLLLWGGVDADSVPYLEPAFVIDAPQALPDSAGEYRITGRTASGAELFSLSFAMPVTADGDGSSGFAFALPVRPGWGGSLATITLSGSEGSVTLDGDSDIPMAILRNPRTGQVRGFLRDSQASLLTQTAADAAGSLAPGVDVLFSRGIPSAEEWRR